MQWPEILQNFGNFEPIDMFTANDVLVEIRCLDCRRTFKRKPIDMKRSKRCPYCAKESMDSIQRTSHDDFINKVRELVGDEFTVLGEYKGTHVPLEIRHNSCGKIISIRPHDFLSGSRCRSCSRTKTTEEFKNEVYQLEGSNYSVIANYIGDSIDILMKHNICGYEFMVRPNNFLQGRRCPKCKRSRGEATVERVLINMGIDYTPQVKFDNLSDKNKLSYDFYIPQYNLLIEYQGIQHYKPVQVFGGESSYAKQKMHDKLKREYAEENNFKLLEIKYTEKSFNSIKALILSSIS